MLTCRVKLISSGSGEFSLIHVVFRCELRLRPSLTGVKLDMLLGNANVNYDPDREGEVDTQTETLVPDRVHVAGERKCQL